MTTRIVVLIAVAALSIAPAALGEGRLAGSNPQTGVEYFKANELATLVQQPVQLDRRTDAWDRTAPTDQSSVYQDAGERSTQPAPGYVGYVDANQRGVGPANPLDVSAASSGSDIEWSQLGIGFGVGILLTAALWVAVRMSRRQLAH